MSSEREVAGQMLAVVPRLMHQIRGEIRAGAKGNLTIPQFRVLANIRIGVAHVGQIAELHGVSQPAMSKMVDALVSRGLIKRCSAINDRRQIKLSLTTKGEKLYQEVRKTAQEQIGQRLKAVSSADLKRLTGAFDVIESLLLTQEDK